MQSEDHQLLTTYRVSKDDLMSIVSKCQQRNVAEEIDFLEELGGNYLSLWAPYAFRR